MRLFPVKFDDTNVKGVIVLNICPGPERLKLLKEINLKTSNDGSLTFDDNMIDSIIKGSELIKKYVVNVEIEVNGEKITTMDDVEYCNSFNAIIMKLLGILLNGPERLGNLP